MRNHQDPLINAVDTLRFSPSNVDDAAINV